MSFVLQNFDLISGSRNNTLPTVYGYGTTTDALATVLGSAYFNNAKLSFQNLKIGDLIIVNTTDETAEWLKVTAVTPNVTTVVDTQTVIPDGSVTNAKVADNAGIFLTKLEDLQQGFMVKGSVASKMEGFDSTGSGKILVGTGTDMASVSVSGDMTLTSAGVLTVTRKGKHNDGGGSATVNVTATGVVATDIAFANIEASTNAVSVQKVTPGVDQIVVLLSGDPGAGTVIAWTALRA